MMEVLKRRRNIAGNSTYNMLVTDGRRIFGTRYNSSPHEASPTLYYATGSRFESHPNGDCFIRDNKEVPAVRDGGFRKAQRTGRGLDRGAAQSLYLGGRRSGGKVDGDGNAVFKVAA
ncbi:MAG: hypothetical protein H6573_02800 [Lewinellaceae bacterium]|nr:hypothetical protein [Lewinellaceae bacterium]